MPGFDVRLRYSSLILFFSKILSAFTGVIFVLLVTRRLSVEDYGLWRMISQYVSYSLILTNVYCYWLPRTMARGVNTSKTGFALSVLLGLVATLFYMGIAFWASISVDQPLSILLVASFNVLLSYIQFAIESVSSGYAPQYNGYATILFEIAKVVFGMVLVLLFHTGILGAILAVECAQLISVILSITLNSRVLGSSKLDFSKIRLWLKYSWLPLFGSGVGIVTGLDVLLVRMISGSIEPISYYGIALTMSGVIGYGGVLASALYPRLLAKPSSSDTETMIKLMYMFTIPTSIFLLIYPELASAIFGLKYLVVTNVLQIAVVSSLVYLCSLFLDTVILGFERADADEMTAKTIVKSMLFKMQVLNYLNAFLYIVLLYAMLVGVQDAIEVSIRWAVAAAASNIVASAGKLIVLKRTFKLNVLTSRVVKSLARYVLAALLAVAVNVSLFKISPSKEIFNLFFSLMPIVALTVIFYFALLYLIDSDFRSFMQAIIKEVLSFLKIAKKS